MSSWHIAIINAFETSRASGNGTRIQIWDCGELAPRLHHQMQSSKKLLLRFSVALRAAL